MYKAIILDLDDTTVQHGVGNLPSPRVAEVIQKASNSIHVSIATGRTLKEAKFVIDHLHLTGPCIISNGAQIYDPRKHKIFHQIFLPEQAIPQVYKICQSNHIQLRLHTDVNEYIYTGIVLPHKTLRMYIPRVKPKLIDVLVDELKQVNGINIQKMPAWDKGFMCVDITSIRASKLHGIVEVARMLRIETSEIIGVGDGYNDFPLLLACGLKIAMGNAVSELKAIADFIAPSVEEDGVATVIEKFVLTR
jgi:5-amino-6-(5-phospho-D-ribitylamino)uracil phosphatase